MQSKQIAIVAALFVLCTGTSFAGFKVALSKGVITPRGGGLAGLISPIVPGAEGGIGVDTSAPKDQVCPLNGAKYTLSEEQAWSKRRPLAVMIENQVDARPQSGLNKSDIVYEAVAEGGITRYMALFYCDAQATDTIVAPVRSARQYFIEFASDYNFPLYAHVGGANGTDSDPKVRALEHLSDYGWAGSNDLNQFSIGYPVFVRNYNRVPGKQLATEHTMEASTYRLWDFAASKRNLTNIGANGKDWQVGFVKWNFQDDADVSARADSEKIAYQFWQGPTFNDYNVAWSYDKNTNEYNRLLAGAPDVDQNDQKQITAKNVVVLFTKEEGPLDIHKHMYYDTMGTGKALIFQDGKEEEVTWSKKDRLARLTFTTKSGKPVAFVRGRIWISVLAVNAPVTVQ